MLPFLKCVAEAIMENGLRGLADLVPGGGFAYDVAKSVLGKYREVLQEAERRADIQQLAQASFQQARQAAEQVAQEVAGSGASDDEITNLELYLAQIPAAVRQSQKRPEDPTGTTVPATFALNSPDDVLKLLPPRSGKFRPGAPLPERAGWVLVEPLGIGGFGEVWLAQHPRLTTLTRAVKFCRDLQTRDLLHESDVIDRVMKEGNIPGIVPLLDAHLDGDTPWLAFEYVCGGDLADVIYEWQTLSQGERLTRALAALHELAVAVGHFHRLRPAVVHRDLKPANILRDKRSNHLRVTDFGIGGVTSRAVLELETRGALTRGGRLLSCLRGSYTALYASPQQRDGGEPDPRDDVHALGVIGYQMLTGQVNRGAGSDFADDLRDAGVGEGLITLLGRCVAYKPDRRPKDAVELAEQLAALSLRPPAPPSIRIESLHPPTLTLATGSVATVTIQISRQNYGQELRVSVSELPSLVTFQDTVLPANQTQVQVVLNAAVGAAPATTNARVIVSGNGVQEVVALLPVSITAPTPQSVPDTLRDLLDNASRFFICNTNRRGSPRIEGEMRQRRYAAVWEDFNWPAHMQLVREGDAILMWAKGVGIIGIGRATAKHEILDASNPDRIRSSAEYAEREWRIPVEWVVWVEHDREAYRCSMPNASFVDASGENYRKLREGVRRHFLRGS